MSPCTWPVWAGSRGRGAGVNSAVQSHNVAALGNTQEMMSCVQLLMCSNTVVPAATHTHTRDPNQPTTYLTRFRKEPQEEQVRMQEALGRNGLQRHCACSIEIASRFTGSGQQNTRS